MTMTTKATPVRAARRNLFAEVSEGIVALAEHREGKRTLRTHGVDCKSAPKVTPRPLSFPAVGLRFPIVSGKALAVGHRPDRAALGGT
jgi:hypothetical protein